MLNDFHGSPSEFDKLEGYKATLLDKKVVLAKLDEIIVEATEDQKINDEIFEASEFRETLNRTLIKIDRVLDKVSSSSKNTESAMTQNQQSGTLPSSTKQKARLPKLTLRNFSGDAMSWQSFWDSFEAAVHNNEDVSKVDKFNYLKSLLDGPAASTIAGFTLTAENYETAVKVLKERFGNDQVIVSRHMDALLSLEGVTKVDEIKKVRKLYDTIETHLRSLQNLGVSSESYGSLCIPVILSRIPEQLRLLMSRKFDKNSWNVNEVLSQLKIEVDARKRCIRRNIQNKKMYIQNKKGNMHGKSRESLSAASLLAGKDEQSKSKPYCVFCEKEHPSVKCEVVTDTAARRGILRRKGKCFLCLRSGHIMRSCPSKLRCFKCGGFHHTALCGDVPNREKKPAPELPKQEATTSALCVDNKTSVLLQTAQNLVGSPNDPNQKINARVIFDSCSQRSYIT